MQSLLQTRYKQHYLQYLPRHFELYSKQNNSIGFHHSLAVPVYIACIQSPYNLGKNLKHLKHFECSAALQFGPIYLNHHNQFQILLHLHHHLCKNLHHLVNHHLGRKNHHHQSRGSHTCPALGNPN